MIEPAEGNSLHSHKADCTCSVCTARKTKTTKQDRGKPPLANLFSDFPCALAEVSQVTGFGDRKYSRGSWKSVEDFVVRYQNAKARHAIAGLVTPGGRDTESGLHHLAHEAWNALALLEHALKCEGGQG